MQRHPRVNQTNCHRGYTLWEERERLGRVGCLEGMACQLGLKKWMEFPQVDTRGSIFQGDVINQLQNCKGKGILGKLYNSTWLQWVGSHQEHGFSYEQGQEHRRG